MKHLLYWNLIPGLMYIPSYINPEVEKELINIIDEQTWITDLKRRVQHYGYTVLVNITSNQHYAFHCNLGV